MKEEAKVIISKLFIPNLIFRTVEGEDLGLY